MVFGLVDEGILEGRDALRPRRGLELSAFGAWQFLVLGCLNAKATHFTTYRTSRVLMTETARWKSTSFDHVQQSFWLLTRRQPAPVSPRTFEAEQLGVFSPLFSVHDASEASEPGTIKLLWLALPSARVPEDGVLVLLFSCGCQRFE